jgi:hypothetical protein
LPSSNRYAPGTYSELIYQIERHYMRRLRMACFLSSELPGILPRGNVEKEMLPSEILAFFDRHLESVKKLRSEIIERYSFVSHVISDVTRFGPKPENMRPEKLPSGITVSDMDAELETILGKDVSELTVADVALKNAIAMYRGKRVFSPSVLASDHLIVNQVRANAGTVPDIMRNILEDTSERIRQLSGEIIARGTDSPEQLSVRLNPSNLLKELGGAIYPHINPKSYDDYLQKTLTAIARGRPSLAPYEGRVEVQDFRFMPPLIHSKPGEGKNSILYALADRLRLKKQTLHIPHTAITDLLMAAYDPNTASVAQKPLDSMLETAINPTMLLLDEYLRTSIEGGTLANTLQALVLENRVNSLYINPACLMVAATNTEEHTVIVGAISEIDPALLDRHSVYEITEEMSRPGYRNFIRTEYGDYVKAGTSVHDLYSFMMDDSELGAGELFGKFEIRESLSESFRNKPPSKRSVETIFKSFLDDGDMELKSHEWILRELNNYAGEELAVRFREYARVAGTLPSMSEMLGAVDGMYEIHAVAGFDAKYRDFVSHEHLSVDYIDSGYFLRVNGGITLAGDEMKRASKMWKKKNAKTLLEYVEERLQQKKTAAVKKNGKKNKGNNDSGLEINDLENKAKLLRELSPDGVKKILEKRSGEVFRVRPGGNGVKYGINSPVVRNLFKQRILSGIEGHVKDCYCSSSPRPLDAGYLKKLFMLLALYPFPVGQDLMITEIMNFLLSMNSEECVRSGFFSQGLEYTDMRTGEKKIHRVEIPQRSGDIMELAATYSGILDSLPVFFAASWLSPKFCLIIGHESGMRSMESVLAW